MSSQSANASPDKPHTSADLHAEASMSELDEAALDAVAGGTTPAISEIVVTKQTDMASPKLLEVCAKGVHP